MRVVIHLQKRYRPPLITLGPSTGSKISRKRTSSDSGRKSAIHFAYPKEVTIQAGNVFLVDLFKLSAHRAAFCIRKQRS